MPQKLDKCNNINSSRVKAGKVGMRITTLIARVNQEWKSRATCNIEHKRYKTTIRPHPKKIQQQKNNTKIKKNEEH